MHGRECGQLQLLRGTPLLWLFVTDYPGCMNTVNSIMRPPSVIRNSITRLLLMAPGFLGIEIFLYLLMSRNLWKKKCVGTRLNNWTTFTFFQATEGKNNTKKPSTFNFVAQVKWSAWNDLGDMTKVCTIAYNWYQLANSVSEKNQCTHCRATKQLPHCSWRQKCCIY